MKKRKGNQKYQKRQKNKDEIDHIGLFNAILHDNSEYFKKIMEKAQNPDIYFSTTKYELPKIISAFPTVISLCAFFSAHNCLDEIISMKPKFDKPDKFGRSVIHFAAASGDISIIQKVASKPEHFNKFDSLGDHPLSYSAMFNKIDAFKYILSKCGDEEIDLIRPLCVAAKYGHYEIIKYIIEDLGVDPNSTNCNVLNCSCSNGNLEIIKYLLEKGCDINKPDEDGVVPLIDAINSGRLSVVKFLIQHKADFVYENDNFTPLIEAAACGYIDIVKYLLSLGVDVNITNKYNATPLQASLEQKHFHLSQFLLKQENLMLSKVHNLLELVCSFGDYSFLSKVFSKCDLKDIADQLQSKKLLTIVLNSGNIKNLQLLINVGMPLNLQDIIFFNLVDMSVRNEDPQLLKYLIDKGADVKKSVGPFKTALKCCIDNKGNISDKMFEIINLLIDSGANIYCGGSRTEFYRKMFDIESPELYQLILQKRPDFDIKKIISLNINYTWIRLCCYKENRISKLFDYFFDNLMDINTTNEDGFNVLQDIIMHKDDKELAERVISKGVDINHLNKQQKSSLLLCAENKRFEIASILLKNKANPNLKDENGNLPIEITSKSDENIYLTLELLNHGSRIGNALDIAIENKSFLHILLFYRSGYQSENYKISQNWNNNQILNYLKTGKTPSKGLFGWIKSLFSSV